MEYKKLQLQDIYIVRPYFAACRPLSCDYTVGGMFMWRDYYAVEYMIRNGVFCSRMRDANNEPYYNLPLGPEGFVLGDLHAFADADDGVIRFATVPEYLLDGIRNGNRVVSVSEQPDFADYLYNASDLSTFRGRKYNGQRNQINHFLRAADLWSFDPITDGNLAEVRTFFLERYLTASGHGAYEEEENRKVLEVLDHYALYGMQGGALYMNGGVVGFSLSETVGQTMFTHVEKADRSVKGAYQMLVLQNAARFAGGQTAYINREEDMGDPGLRESKESYHPVSRIRKYVVEVNV